MILLSQHSVQFSYGAIEYLYLLHIGFFKHVLRNRMYLQFYDRLTIYRNKFYEFQ